MPSMEYYMRAHRSPRTRRVYKSVQNLLVQWCIMRGFSPELPIPAETVCHWLADLATSVRYNTLRTYAQAVGAWHTDNGHPSPALDPRVRRILDGIKRERRDRTRRVRPLTVPQLVLIHEQIPATRRGLRDWAILLVGFAGAFRRAEIASIDCGDLETSSVGTWVHLRNAKTDRFKQGQSVLLPYGSDLCPIDALGAWMQAGDISAGPVFRSVSRADNVLPGRIYPGTIGRLVKAYVGAIGLDPIDFGGHSLRAGFVTAAMAKGMDIRRIQRHTRHRSRRSVETYYRDQLTAAEDAELLKELGL